MILSSDDLLKIIHDTKAVSIWNHKTGPVFWYAAAVPGPFYVNTELAIGSALAEKLLRDITAIIAATSDPAARAARLNEAILTAYDANPVYQQIVKTMVAAAKASFPDGSYALVSGGERRDWLFSIPFAREAGVPHAFLFKNQDLWCATPIAPHATTLHVADLINNAASYFDLWLPILEKAHLRCIGTVCLNSRGSNGLQRLAKANVKVVALNGIDLSFFEKSRAGGLIDADTLAEIAAYFASPQEWAKRYLIGNAKLFDAPHIDAKSFERLRSFFTNDPWSLKKDNEAFFAAMRTAIEERARTA